MMTQVQASVSLDPQSDDFIVGRYPGSSIADISRSPSLEAEIVVSLNNEVDTEIWQKEDVVGDNVVAIYSVSINNDVSALKIYNSIKQSLEQSGAKFIVDCSGVNAECGFYMPRRIARINPRRSFYDRFENFWNLNKGEYYMLVSELVMDDQQYFVSSVVANNQKGTIHYSVDVLKKTEVVFEQLISSSQVIKESIEASGRAVLGGLYFETDKVDLKVSSNPSLKEIADYLKDNEDKNYYVVGHTDDVGSKDYNISLSEGRAKSVIDGLVKKFNVSNKNLEPVGLGLEFPVVENINEDSRAKNRRVELILKDSEQGKTTRIRRKELKK